MMGLLKQLRSSLENPATPLSFPAEWLLDLFTGGRTNSGTRVSELTALQVSTVYACVDIIASNLARLPLNVYERKGEAGFRLAEEQNSHWLLHNEPNPEMTSFVFRKALQCHALLWSNLYAEIQRNGASQPVALWPRMPQNTTPRRALKKLAWRTESGEMVTVEPGELYYTTKDGVGNGSENNGSVERPIHASDMIHIPGLSLDGRVGRSVIEMAREAVGLALAAEKFGGKFFANGLRPSGVVTLPMTMKTDAVANFKKTLQEAYSGENIHRPIVLEEGMTWNQNDTKPQEAQFMELRAHQRDEICAIFHVPPHMAGASAGSNRATAEQMSIEFVQYTLGPWTVPWEQELQRKMFPQRGRTANKYYPGFDTEELMWPDAESRGKYFAMLKQWGIANTDDIRRKIRQNPIGGPEGTKYWRPVNMTDASVFEDPNKKPVAGKGKGKEDPAQQDDPEAARYASVYADMFDMAFEQGRRAVTSGRFYRAFAPVLNAIAEGISLDSWLTVGLNEQPELSEQVREGVASYVGGHLLQRTSSWNGDPDACAKELYNAVVAVRSMVHRDLEQAKKKQDVQGAQQ
jgi:HK97 family phage portal protein